MIRKLIAVAAVSGSLALGVGGVAGATTPSTPTVPTGRDDGDARHAVRQGREAGRPDSDGRDQGGGVGPQGPGP